MRASSENFYPDETLLPYLIDQSPVRRQEQYSIAQPPRQKMKLDPSAESLDIPIKAVRDFHTSHKNMLMSNMDKFMRIRENLEKRIKSLPLQEQRILSKYKIDDYLNKEDAFRSDVEFQLKAEELNRQFTELEAKMIDKMKILSLRSDQLDSLLPTQLQNAYMRISQQISEQESRIHNQPDNFEQEPANLNRYKTFTKNSLPSQSIEDIKKDYGNKIASFKADIQGLLDSLDQAQKKQGKLLIKSVDARIQSLLSSQAHAE